mgnify:CR=1 FL=1|tara:strand:- start:165 stop:464 length:300 start_codon:yes stop_codon:yes gene_type:complete
MKHEVFKKYSKEIAELFRMDRTEIFKKSKRRECVDARHLLYFLCATRPMRIKYIEDYMRDEGYDISHSSIIHGIKCVEDKIMNDRDYKSIIKKIESCVV